MASELKVDKFTGVTTAGSIDVTGEGNSTTTNLQQGLAKAWFQLNCTGTPANRGSFNVSSVTDNATGNMTENFTASMNDQNYATVGMAGGKSGSYTENFNHYYVDNPCLTGSVQVAIDYNNSLSDGERVAGQVSGDLA